MCDKNAEYDKNVLNNKTAIYNENVVPDKYIVYKAAGYIRLSKADRKENRYYSDSIYMPFEYIEVPVPVGYDKILRQKYGDDYMIPYIGGTNHEYPFYNTQKRVLYSQLGIEI